MRSSDSAPPLPAGLTAAVRHGLGWLVVGNAIGVAIAVLLLLPGVNVFLGEWTYGRWMMVHMNTALFGWCSVPMLGVLFKTYGAQNGAARLWCRPVVWLWSTALVVGSCSWLSGHSSGKLFLDWSGFARVFFPLAILAVWVLLAMSFVRTPNQGGRTARILKAAGLLVLLGVPFAIYMASSPGVYPAVNPDTGGPTGESQLESTLGVVVILLTVPYMLTRRRASGNVAVWAAWILLAAEAVFCTTLARGDISHRVPAQYLGLAAVLLWVPLVPAYYSAFQWNATSRRWKLAFLWWWGGLTLTGWLLFLPGVLDKFKFTDMLVGHSLAAVAGFLSAFILFAMVQLVGDEHAWILNRTWSFYAWNGGVLAYVVVMAVAGWIESANPAFTIIAGPGRNALYTVRLLTGIAMLAGSVEWLVAARSLSVVTSSTPNIHTTGVKVA